MPRFLDPDRYDAWGQDHSETPQEAAYWLEMTPGSDDRVWGESGGSDEDGEA